MSTYLYQPAFQFFKLGCASAQAWILFLIVVVFTALIFRISGRLVYDGGR
jgi:multiple sugar transport system permease protein